MTVVIDFGVKWSYSIEFYFLTHVKIVVNAFILQDLQLSLKNNFLTFVYHLFFYAISKNFTQIENQNTIVK